MSQPPNTKELPESLKKQLAQFKVQVWRIKILEAVLAGIFGLVVSFIVVFALDRFFPTPEMVRLGILIAGVSLFAIFAPLWINRWVFKHRKENQIAHLIAKQYPRLGDRLLGVVELQNQQADDASLSSRLREAAMTEVANDVQKRDLKDALPPSWHKKWTLAVLAVAGVTVTVFTLTPKASWNAFQRWLMPLADIERYTETRIDENSIPQPYYVAHGEDYTLNIKLTQDSNIPDKARARVGIAKWNYVAPDERSYAFEFKEILKEQTVEVQIGDAFADIKVTPIMRPTVKEVSAQITYPAYLQKADEIIDLTTGSATIVQGSQVQIKARTNRPLNSADAMLKEQPLDLPALPERNIRATVHNDSLTLDSIEIKHDRATIPLNWQDIYQLDNGAPNILTLRQQIDDKPSVYLQDIENEVYVLADTSIEFDVFAEDDFGMKIAGIEWQGSFTKPSPHQPAKGSLPLVQGDPNLKTLSERMIFSFQAYDIKPQRLVMRAWAEDYNPDHARSYSAPITVYVLSKEEHRELIERQTQNAINELEDLMRAELDLLDENLRLDRKEGNELQQQENREKLADQANRELENAEAMEELAQKMEDIFKDASRNGEIDKDTMQKLAEAALNMREMADQKMPDIAKDLNNAQSPENTEQKTKDDLKKAIEKQNDLVQKMEETIQKANEANKQLEAGTFVNRLRKAANDERQLANTVIENIQPQTSLSNTDQATEFDAAEQRFMGKAFNEVDPTDQRGLFDLYDLQEQINSDVRWIKEDLGHFFSRTQKPEHKELLDAMNQSNIDEDLESILETIEANHNGKTMYSSMAAAELLQQWASQLQNAGNNDQQGGGGGGGGGGNSPDDDFEFMLRVLELIQKEQNIRGRTRSLEQKRRLLEINPELLTPTPLK